MLYEVITGKKDETYTLDYTRNGGHLISYSCERTIGPRSLGYKEARAESEKFLKEKGYPNMTAVSYDQYDNIGSLTFVNKQGDVLIYPEKVTVRVGLDNGQVTGLQASDYVYERDVNQKIPKPKLTVDQARKYLNSDFKEKYNRLALIKNDLSDKVLTFV